MKKTKPIYAHKFKFYSYDKKAVKNIHNNQNFKRINKLWFEDYNYLLITINILKTIPQSTQTKKAFISVCELRTKLYLKNNEIALDDDDKSNELFLSLYNVSTNIKEWTKFIANLVEYIVARTLKTDGFKVFNEPEVRYKRRNIVPDGCEFSKNKFDIGSHKNKSIFILGECKTSLKSYIRKSKKGDYLVFKNNAKMQIEKMRYIHNKIIKSKHRDNETVYCKKYLFVLNKVTSPYRNFTGIKVVDLEEVMEENFYFKDLGIISH